MAANPNMVLVKVGDATFRVHKNEIDDYLKSHKGAEVVGGYGTKQETKPAAKKAPAKKSDGKE